MEPQDIEIGTDDELFEEVDLFDTALIQGGCTDDAQLVSKAEGEAE